MGSNLLQQIGTKLQKSRVLRWVAHHGSVAVGTTFSEAIPMYFVIGYPKSGTTWVTQLVADYLMMPYPQHMLLPATFPAVIHGHEAVERRLLGACVYTVRDPRDAVLSYYWRSNKQLKGNESSGALLAYQRSLLKDPESLDDHEGNLPVFIERYLADSSGTKRTWSEHVRTYLDHKDSVPLVKYEDLLDDAIAEMSRALAMLTGEEINEERLGWAVQKYDFANRRKVRTPGTDKGFLRAGRSGGWREWLTRESASIFQRECGRELIEIGYEADEAWVDACPQTLAEREPEAAHA